MARIFRRRRKCLTVVRGPDGKTIRLPSGRPEREPLLDSLGRPVYRLSRRWSIEWRDTDGKLRTTSGETSQRASMAKAVRLEEGAALIRQGVRSRCYDHQIAPLETHLAAFEKYLQAKDDTAKHVGMTLQRLRVLAKACAWRRIADIRSDTVLGWLAERRRTKDVSAETSNHYVRAVKGLGRWLVRSGRADADPVIGLTTINAAMDRRHARRPLSEDELGLLIKAARSGPPILGLSGEARALVYLLAVTTGLRANEIRTLTPEAFDLDATPPIVTVEAAYSKRRRRDEQPVGEDVAAALRTWLDEHGEAETPVFPLPGKTARMLRADLEAAGIPIRDGSGRVVDFHALRTTFGTRLARAGVHPKLAQDLMRHSTINLTMNLYTMTVLGERAAALAKLPAVGKAGRRPSSALGA